MGQTEVEIANRALLRLGLQPLSSATLSEAAASKSASAALLNNNFDEWKKELLQIHPWTFATSRLTLINPVKQNPASISIREFNENFSTVSPTYDYVELDLRPEITSGVDHGLYDFDVIKIKDSLAPELNDKMFYVKRGRWLSSTWTPGPSFVTLFKRIGSDGTLVEPVRRDEVPTISWGSSNRYTGTVESTEKSEFNYQYFLPSNVLRLIEVREIENEDEWVVQRRDTNEDTEDARVILCNVEDSINIQFVNNITIDGTNEIDRLFAEALSLKCALNLSEALVKTTSLTREIEAEYMRAVTQAKSIDAQENSPKYKEDSSWFEEMRRST